MLPTNCEVIVVGGGAVGLSVAYHLGHRGISHLCLLERDQLGSGTTWHAAGIVGPLRATPNMTRLAMYATELFPRLENETGLSTGYRQTGGYWLARETERLDELRRIRGVGRSMGLDVHELPPASLQTQTPLLNINGVCGALSVAEDGSVNPIDLCNAYARAIKNTGNLLSQHISVVSLVHKKGRIEGVQLSDGSTLLAPVVVLCCGAWSRQLAEPAGVALPLQGVEHMYVVTTPEEQFANFPVVRDLDRGIYVKGDAGKLIIGGFETDAKCLDVDATQYNEPFLQLPEDWEQFTPFMEAALQLIPSLNETEIRHFMNGPESFTVDTRPLVGPTPQLEGLYVAAGMNSVGIMSSAGVGRLLADWIIDDMPSFDAWEIDVARADPLSAESFHLQERMREAVADQFAMHWPFKQPVHGRNLRCSVLHNVWKNRGAVFGVSAGWERPLWFAESPTDRNLPYSVASQAWEPIVAREVSMLSKRACVLELSPFTKIEVSGDSALQALNYLSTANVDIKVNAMIYTQLLNDHAGIEADVTITRIGQQRFRIYSGAATRWRDLAYLKRGLRAYGDDVRITDVTEQSAIIGLMGGGSYAFLAGAGIDERAGQGQSIATLGLRQSGVYKLFGIDVRASRLSFLGEFGWELEVELAHAGGLLERVLEAGATPIGHYALESCRLEKAYRHWGHDIGAMLNPLEAGLGFTIDWRKPFVGKRALEHYKQSTPVAQRLYLCSVMGTPLLLHDEPVWQQGKVVGMSTSGGKGFRTNLTLCFVLFDSNASWSVDDSIDIEVAGKHYPATVLRNSPFDPQNLRMKGTNV